MPLVQQNHWLRSPWLIREWIQDQCRRSVKVFIKFIRISNSKSNQTNSWSSWLMTHTDCSIVLGKLRNLTLSWLNNAATARNFPFYWWKTSIIPIVFPVTMTKAKNSKTVSKLLKSILPGGTSSIFRGNRDHPLSLAMYRHTHEWKLGFNWFWTKLALPTGTKVSLALTMDVVMHKNHISGASRECPFLMLGGWGVGGILLIVTFTMLIVW